MEDAAVLLDPDLAEVREEFQAWLAKTIMKLASDISGSKAPRRLKQIQDLSEIGRDLTMVLGGPDVRRGGRLGKGAIRDDDFMPPMPPSLNPVTAVETFGAKILQEGLASLPEIMMVAQAPNLIRGVDAARKAGLAEVADELQRKLHHSLNLDFAKKIEVSDGTPFEDDDPVRGLPRPPVTMDDEEEVEGAA